MLTSIILMVLAGYALLHTSPVQSYVLQRITNYLSRELETEVVIGSMDFKPFRSIVLHEVLIEDRQGGEMLAVTRFDVYIRKISFRHRYVAIREVALHEARIGFSRNLGDTAYNFSFIIDYLSNGNTNRDDLERWRLTVSSLRIENTNFHMADSNRTQQTNGFDHSDFSLKDLNLAARDIHILGGQLMFEIDYLRYRGSAGFRLDHLSGSFSLGKQQSYVSDFLFRTASSDIRIDLSAQYGDLNGEPFNWDDLEMSLNVRPSRVWLADIGHFVPQVFGVSDTLSIAGFFKALDGTFNAYALDISGGENSKFLGDIRIEGIEHIHTANLDIQIDQFRSSIKDITAFRLPLSWNQDSIELPSYLFALGDILFSGKVKGGIGDFNAAGRMDTDIGWLDGDVLFFRDEANSLYQYEGVLEAGSFDLGVLFDEEAFLGKVSMSKQLQGQGFTMDDLFLEISGNIHALQVLGHDYQNMKLEGSFKQQKFNGNFLLDDPNIFLDFRGKVDFNDPVPLFDFQTYIDQAQLSRLNIFQRDSLYESVLSADVLINARANSLDDLEGVIRIKDLVYDEYPLLDANQYSHSFRYATDSILISNTLWADNIKHLRVRSDILDANMHGSFQLAGLGDAFRLVLFHYLPALNFENSSDLKRAGLVQDISFDLSFKDTRKLTDLFLPAVSISDGAWLNGNFNTASRHLDVQAAADTINIGGRHFVNWELTGTGEYEKFLVNSNSDRLMLSDSLFMNNVAISAGFFDDSVDMFIDWNPDDQINSGHLHLKTQILGPDRYQINFLPSQAYIDGDLWRVNIDNKILIDPRRVEIRQLRVYYKDQFFYADGVLSEDPADRMMLSFADFDVSYSELLMRSQNFQFAGSMDGYINFSGLYQAPSIAAELFVSGFAFNHITLGDLEVVSVWDEVHEAFKVDASITKFREEGITQPLIVSGFINPTSEDQNFDLDLQLDNKPMSVWGRYMQNFADDFHGFATGNLRMDGRFDSPELSGRANVKRAGIHIPYLNVTYSFDDEVEIGKSYFRFNNLVLRDSLNNQATLSGDIMHQVFKDFAMDLRINPDRMMVFNTGSMPQDFYYGTAFLTGMAHIHGPANDIIMDISARTNRGTSVNLPLNYGGEIRESHFISFVSREEIQEGPLFIFPELRGQLTLNFDLEVTPDADVFMFFDTRFGDIIRGRGTGNLKLEVSPQGAFNIYGDYVIEDGEYIFTLQNIINKRFRIEQGSSVRWTGDLNDADVDLRAAYRLRTSMYDLLVGQGVDDATAEVYRRRIPVETILILEDKLFNPFISFDIQVPGGDENTRELIERVITTDQEMNRQVFSLLVLNRFMPTTPDQYNTALGYGVGSTSSELLSNQLSNWLSQISSDFDIGVNYRPGDELTSQELELALSTQLFDDRVMIDGNFGVAGNQTATGHATQSTSQIIGDVNVEVKITSKLRVKAFNRSNTFDIINTNSPYTQGVGLFYRREFDSLTELFRRSLQEPPDHID